MVPLLFYKREMRKLRYKFHLDKAPRPESFVDVVTGGYGSLWRGESVKVGVSFFEGGQLVEPNVDALTLIVRQHQKADGSHLFVKKLSEAINSISLAEYNAGEDHLEITLNASVTLSWSCDNRLKRPLWMVLSLVTGEGTRHFHSGWIDLHESSGDSTGWNTTTAVQREIEADGESSIFSHADIGKIYAVFLNGIQQGESQVTIDGETATFITPPQEGDEVTLLGDN